MLQIISRDGGKVADVEIMGESKNPSFVVVLLKSTGREITVPYEQLVWRSQDWYI